MTPIPFVNGLLNWVTLLSNILVVYLLVEIIYYGYKKRFIFERVRGAIKNKGVGFMFLISLIAMLGSLYYSEIAGYNPCVLCWYQRIFMYSQVFLLGFAFFRRDKRIIPYAFLLSIIGFLIAGYHYIMQISRIDSVICDVVGYSASCSESFFLSLGYITIPMMAASAFLLIVLFGWITKLRRYK